MNKLLTVIGIIGCFIAVLGGTYNSLVNKDQDVQSAWSQVQNVYQRRMDLIPNLVSTVQGAASFEKSVFVEVAQARASVGSMKVQLDKMPENQELLKQYVAAQEQLKGSLSRLLAVAENYPQLKATEAFRDLQVQLEGTENRITVERGRYNEAVQIYNKRVKGFPSNLVAKMCGFKEKQYFEATSSAQNVPAVSFNKEEK